jgi:hypothetical protein
MMPAIQVEVEGSAACLVHLLWEVVTAMQQ